MSDPIRPKTMATNAVEGFLAGGLMGALGKAAAESPPPPLSEPGELVTPDSIVGQIRKRLANGEFDIVSKLSLILACWMARIEGTTFGDAAKAAAVAWQQTAGLTPVVKSHRTG